MKRFVLVCAVILACSEPVRPLPSFEAAPFAAGSVSHFMSNGDIGQLQWFTTDAAGTFTTYTLEVQSSGQDSAFLFYTVDAINVDSDPPVRELAVGFGTVPGSALRGGGGALALECDLATLPGFIVLAGSPGPLSVRWRPLQGVSATQRGTQTLRRSDLVFRTQGYTESTTAAVEGNFAGFDIPATAFAFTGRSHAVTVEVARDSI